MLVHFEQVLSDLKGFRDTFGEETFPFKMFTLLETRITSKRFSVVFGFFEVFDRFRFCAFWPFWLCQRFLNDYF